MCVLTQKLKHKKFSYVNQIDSEELYKMVQKANVPFYEWNDYIKLYLDRSYLVRSKRIDDRLLLPDKLKLMTDMKKVQFFDEGPTTPNINVDSFYIDK